MLLCQGQITQPSAKVPSASGPSSWVHLAHMACTRLPSRYNSTSVSPARTTRGRSGSRSAASSTAVQVLGPADVRRFSTPTACT